MENNKYIGQTILEQLGGNKFLVMTGCKNLLWDNENSTLRMTIPKNGSKANRLWITYNWGTDTYIMRFFKYVAPRLNTKTYTFSEEKITEVAKFEEIYCDQLEELFTEVTKMYTRLW